MGTIENLKEAFAGESQANRRYLAFAGKAAEEGYPQVARLFRAAAEAETVHALNHLRILKEVGSTEENLGAAITGETYEFRQMYPKFLEEARKEKRQDAAWSFDVANKVEEVHARLYSKALESLKAGRRPSVVEYYVCQVCGNTVEGEAPEKCPICGAPRDKFRRIE
jgi:rubrerythrin